MLLNITQALTLALPSIWQNRTWAFTLWTSIQKALSLRLLVLAATLIHVGIKFSEQDGYPVHTVFLAHIPLADMAHRKGSPCCRPYSPQSGDGHTDVHTE